MTPVCLDSSSAAMAGLPASDILKIETSPAAFGSTADAWESFPDNESEDRTEKFYILKVTNGTSYYIVFINPTLNFVFNSFSMNLNGFDDSAIVKLLNNDVLVMVSIFSVFYNYLSVSNNV
jgi:hypothetical protein